MMAALWFAVKSVVEGANFRSDEDRKNALDSLDSLREQMQGLGVDTD